MCNNTLYLFDYVVVEKILTEFYRILKRDGKIIITNPSIKFSMFRFIIRLIKIYDKKILKKLSNFFVPYVKLIFFNIIINFKLKKKHFYKYKEQTDLMLKFGFKNVREKEVYLDLSYLVVSKK